LLSFAQAAAAAQAGASVVQIFVGRLRVSYQIIIYHVLALKQ
jgi:transaldolase